MKDGNENRQLALLLPERAESAKSSARGFGARIRGFFGIECPTCRKAVVPFGESHCPGCGAVPTLKSAIDTTFGSTKRGLENKVRYASRKTIRRLQWAYLILSGALLWSLLPLLEAVKDGKILSVGYVTALGLYVVWLSPRKWRVAFFATSGTIKFAISLNFFSFLAVLQLFIKAHLSVASEMVTLFVIAWVAGYILHMFVLPIFEATIYALLGGEEQSDPTVNQGRRVRVDP